MALYSSKTSTSGMKRNKSRLTMGYQVKKRVLVIDDIGVILDLVEFLLQKGGYDVMTATDAASALAQIEKITPDLILLDIMMPDISGYEFIAQLRQHQNHYASIPPARTKVVCRIFISFPTRSAIQPIATSR